MIEEYLLGAFCNKLFIIMVVPETGFKLVD